MLNKVMIIGRLGQDPELKYAANGMPIATLNVATDESYTDRDGNKVDRTEWHRIVVFQRQAENCANFLAKGSLVYVEGSLQTRKWQDQQGQNRYTTEIKAQRVQFLDRRGDRQATGAEGYGDRSRGGRGQQDHSGGRDYHDNYAGGARHPATGHAQRQPRDEDLGPAFPSEAAMDAPASMDEVPF